MVEGLEVRLGDAIVAREQALRELELERAGKDHLAKRRRVVETYVKKALDMNTQEVDAADIEGYL